MTMTHQQPPAAAASAAAPDLIEAMTSFVTQCMRDHDPSHNPAHVHRVVALAHKILDGERSRITNGNTPSSNGQPQYDGLVVTLAALLHDIGDRKYLPNIINGTTAPSKATDHGEGGGEEIDPSKMVERALLSHGASPSLAARVQTIVSNVSYTNECASPDNVRQLISKDGGYPELAIVQDADRLDALGAVGIGRCFTFLGSEQGKRIWLASKTKGKGAAKWEMENSIEHFGEKLEKLEGMMKTETGREMAKVRTERLKVFKSWWEEETREIGL